MARIESELMLFSEGNQPRVKRSGKFLSMSVVAMAAHAQPAIQPLWVRFGYT